MYHLVLIALVAALSLLGWRLVNSSPRVIALVLPRNVTFIFGAVFLIMGLFSAFCAALVYGSSELILGCLVQSFVGLFFVFAGSAGLRGYASYDQTTRRVGIMMALLIATIIGIFYLPDSHFVAVLNLGLITAGYFLTAELRQPARR